MENKATDKNNSENTISSVTNSDHKIVCRKCGGPHFTIKCGKENKQPQPEPVPEKVLSKEKPDDKKFVKKDLSKKDNNEEKTTFKKPYFKVTYRVKISDLPNDMTEEEMMELTCDWGHIVRLKVINYDESSTSYVDFGYEEEAEYFIKAIDKTPFNSIIISATRVESLPPKSFTN